MAVSDESAGGTNGRTPRKPQVNLTKEQWDHARIQYESGSITLRKLASVYGISRSTICQKSMRDHWQKGSAIIREARNQLNAATSTALVSAAEDAAKQITRKVMDDLQPWIEKEKRAHIRAQVRRSKSSLKRLDLLSNSDKPLAPKDESFIAKSVDTYDGVIRRNLGMSDGASVAGALNVNILTGSAAVQFAPAPSQA